MSLIKISNFRLRFGHPVVLNPEKKYKLGVSHLLFPFDKKFEIKNFDFEFYIPVPDTTSFFTPKYHILGKYTIDSLQKDFQKIFNEAFNGVNEQNKKDKKFDINKKIKNNSCKI